jgi:hypothetical protein
LHAPHDESLSVSFASQPLSGCPSQLSKPAMQVNPHVVPVHVVFAFATVGQVVLHCPVSGVVASFGAPSVFVTLASPDEDAPLPPSPLLAPPSSASPA